MSRADGLSSPLPVEDIRPLDLEAATVEFDRKWQQGLLRPLLLTLMLGCVVTAATYVFVVLIPSFTESMANLIVLCSTCAALTGCIVGAMTWNAARDVRERLKFRIIEPVGWILLLRLGLWFVAGGMPPATQILQDPLPTIFDGLFIAGSLSVLAIWLVAEFLNRSLLMLSLQPDEVNHIARAYGRLSDTVENTLRSDRRALLDRFIGVWIGIGILVIVLAAGSQVRPVDGNALLTIHAQNIHPRAIVSTIIYFFAGLLLVGQARLVALRARWALDGLAVEESRFRSWMLYVVGGVALVALVTSLVPIGDTILLLRIVMAVWRFVQVGVFLLLRALGWLASLFPFGDSGPDSALTPPPFEMAPPLQVEEELSATGPDFSDLPTLVFWFLGAVAALIGGYHLLAVRGFDWSWIRARLALLLALFRRTIEAGRHIVADVLNRATGRDIMAKSQAERQARHPMDLDGQVQRTYLSVLDAAAAQGVGRRAAETPRHYAPRLAAALASTEAAEAAKAAESSGEQAAREPRVAEAPDVESATTSFYKARYSVQTSDSADLTRVQSLRERIRTLWPRHTGDAADG